MNPESVIIPWEEYESLKEKINTLETACAKDGTVVIHYKYRHSYATVEYYGINEALNKLSRQLNSTKKELSQVNARYRNMAGRSLIDRILNR